MILYHYTSGRHLRGIGSFGLTVGDVPTDISRGRGRIGVWLTSAATAGGHGLEGSAVNKRRYRLAVKVREDAPLLHQWTHWASKNVTAETIAALHNAAAEHDGEGPSSWYIYLGVLPASTILSCVDMENGTILSEWSEVSPVGLDIKGVPPWRRQTWHRQLLKEVERASRTVISRG